MDKNEKNTAESIKGWTLSKRSIATKKAHVQNMKLIDGKSQWQFKKQLFKNYYSRVMNKR